MTRRVEFTVSDDQWQALEDARGELPRATFIKRKLFGLESVETKVWDVRPDPVEGLASTVPVREMTPEEKDLAYRQRRMRK